MGVNGVWGLCVWGAMIGCLVIIAMSSSYYGNLLVSVHKNAMLDINTRLDFIQKIITVGLKAENFAEGAAQAATKTTSWLSNWWGK